jgi:hypothetical protein
MVETPPGRAVRSGGRGLRVLSFGPDIPGLFLFSGPTAGWTSRSEVRAIKEQRVRVNDQIRISPIRLIGGDGEQVGIVSLDEARERAEDSGLDLVEVAPEARPPVCKLMDYGKFKYERPEGPGGPEEAAHGFGEGGEVPPRNRGTRLRVQDPACPALPGGWGQGAPHDDVPGRQMAHSRVGVEVLEEGRRPWRTSERSRARPVSKVGP